MVKFKGIPWETGKSVVVTIPKAYIDNDIIEKGKEYQFEVSLIKIIKLSKKKEVKKDGKLLDGILE